MNPFDLPGPSFLVFYFMLCAVVTVGLRLVFVLIERGQPPSLPLQDPYRIAWLRGGAPEAARVAVLSLVDRGLLEVRYKKLMRCGPMAAELPRQGLEWAIYSLAGSPVEAPELFKDAAVVGVCEAYRLQLAQAGLAPNAAAQGNRLLALALALVILLGAAGLKAELALARGKQNLGFLAIMAVIAVYVLWLQTRRRRTRIGDLALADLRRLFAALKDRAASIQPGRMTSDALLLAAVFGLSALPGAGFAALQGFFPKASGSSGGDGGSSCGSGGCGGGGGCGGCGS